MDVQRTGAGANQIATRGAAKPVGFARPAGLARFRVALGLAILASLAAASASWSYAPLTLSGRLADVDGAPISGATIQLQAGSRVDATAISGRSGTWSITGGHRIDDHQLLISAPGFLGLIEGGQPAPGRTLVLPHLPTLVGTAVDENGTPIPTAEVVLERARTPELWSIPVGADGTFTLERQAHPGAYSVTASAPDHDFWQGTIHLRAESRTAISVVLPRQLATVEFASNPAGLHPLLDGKPLAGCAATPCTVSVPVGSHTLDLSTDLYVPWQQKVELANRQKVAVSATLERKQGTLHLSTPRAGELSIDNSPVDGMAWNGLLPTGVHSVAFRSDATWPVLAQVSVEWNRDVSITLASAVTPVAPGEQAGFLAGLDAYLKAAGGQYGVYFQDLKTGKEFGYHQDDVMEAASVIKLPMALYVLHQVDAGALKLTDQVTIQNSDFMGGTGILNGTASAGDKYAIGDLLKLMIQQSDNTAWQTLQRALGADATDAYAASLGAPDCHQVDDNCTAHEAGLLLAQLYKGKALKPDGTALLLDLMSNTVFNDRINRYLGGLRIAHKTGADGGVMNDVGVVYAPEGPFLISMFSFTDEGTVQPIRDVARAARHYFAGH